MPPFVWILVAVGLAALAWREADQACMQSEMQQLFDVSRRTARLIKHLESELRGLKREFELRTPALPPERREELWQPVEEIKDRSTEALLDNDNVEAVKELELAVREARALLNRLQRQHRTAPH